MLQCKAAWTYIHMTMQKRTPVKMSLGPPTIITARGTLTKQE